MVRVQFIREVVAVPGHVRGVYTSVYYRGRVCTCNRVSTVYYNSLRVCALHCMPCNMGTFAVLASVIIILYYIVIRSATAAAAVASDNNRSPIMGDRTYTNSRRRVPASSDSSSISYIFYSTFETRFVSSELYTKYNNVRIYYIITHSFAQIIYLFLKNRVIIVLYIIDRRDYILYRRR